MAVVPSVLLVFAVGWWVCYEFTNGLRKRFTEVIKNEMSGYMDFISTSLHWLLTHIGAYLIWFEWSLHTIKENMSSLRSQPAVRSPSIHPFTPYEKAPRSNPNKSMVIHPIASSPSTLEKSLSTLTSQDLDTCTAKQAYVGPAHRCRSGFAE